LRVVCNTSPLLLLAKIQRLDLLVQLYDEIIIPEAVLDEIWIKPAWETDQVRALLEERNYHRRKASGEYTAELSIDLGHGERETIALAMETKADLVIIDDHQGRAVSQSKNLQTTGTIGVFIEAKERGFIYSLRNELDQLIEAGMWISEIFYHRILQEFGE
jgi:predicted nucleic acid-binding protein